MWSLGGLRLAAGHCLRLYERNASSSLRFTRNTDLKRINGFCTKPQESPKTPTQSYRHGVPLHKPTDFEKKILLWSGRFKKEEEIPETISFEMLDAAKNKLRVKVSYLMIALTVAGCIYMVIEGKKVRVGSSRPHHAFPKDGGTWCLAHTLAL